MALFSYTALENNGRHKSGVINASSVREARDLLRTQGLMVTNVGVTTTSTKQCKLKNDALIAFTTQLAQMIKAGIPLYESLLCLEEQYRDEKVHPIFLNLCDTIKSGSSLSEAMSMYPESFDQLYCALVAAGESSGALDETLEKLASLLSRRLKMKKQITTAMVYPAVLGGFSLCVIISLMTFVVPSIESVFGDTPANGLTSTILSISHFLTDYWFLYIPGTIGSITLSFWKLRTPSGKKWLDKVFLKLPLVNDFIKKNSIARFTRTLASLLKGGVSLIEAMKIARKVITNAILEKVITDAEAKVIEGSTLSIELKKSQFFPNLISQMIATGENSGNMAGMLNSIADMYESEVEKTLTRLTTLVQPVILVVMGFIVGLIMLAVLLPLTDISTLSMSLH
jgi:general secretion pathway protein F